MKFRELFYIKRVKASNHIVLRLFGIKMSFRIRYGQEALKDEIALLKNRLIKLDSITNVGNILFYVPMYKTDLIQKYIVEKKKFFEQNILLELLEYIPDNSAVILDIGANIGNHTLYWAGLCNAKTVYAFEPVKSTFEILSKNVELNKLENNVKLFNLALSDEKTAGCINGYHETNIGGVSVRKATSGDLAFERLDNITIEDEKIDLVKIDVEGHELFVLKGALATLEKYRPAVFIETGNPKDVAALLAPFGYKLKKEFENSNFLFLAEKLSGKISR